MARRVFVFLVHLMNLMSHRRYVVPCIGFSNNIQTFVAIVGEYVEEVLEKGIKVGRQIILVLGFQASTEADAGWLLQIHYRRCLGPGIFVFYHWGQLFGAHEPRWSQWDGNGSHLKE